MRCASSFPRARPLAVLAALGWLLGPTSAVADDRSTELLRYECTSSLSRRDVTLFANGTVRLRQGPWEEQRLYLDELLREELGSYVAQLREIQASAERRSVELPSGVPVGEWAEECEIRLALAGAEPVTYSFTAFEIPPLEVSRLIHVAEDLASFTRTPEKAARLPEGYRPRTGDVLRTRTDRLFRVVMMTSDERGVELEELGTPVMMVVPVDELGETFAALERPGTSGAKQRWPRR